MGLRKTLGLALLCSLSVYVVPIIGPHAIFTIGESLAQHFRQSARYPGWALTELGATLLLQAIAFALFVWFWRRRSVLSVIALLIASVAAVIEAQPLYFAYIPARFLIEPETAQEKTAHGRKPAASPMRK
jgi:hypothetical protein